VGFALGAVSGISKDHADVILMGDTPAGILDLIDLSSLTMKTVRQNLFFSFFYNALGIPLAVAGLLNPLVAVFAMFSSSLSVIGNSLRIMRGSTVRSNAFGFGVRRQNNEDRLKDGGYWNPGILESWNPEFFGPLPLDPLIPRTLDPSNP